MSGRYAHLLDAIELAEPGYVLEFFAEHAKRAAQGERLPVFELFLNSGQTLKGTPIKVMQRNHRFLAAIETFEGSGHNFHSNNPVKELTYIDCGSIAALRLHEPTAWTHLMSFGNVAAPLHEDPLSRLQAKREIPELWAKAMTDLGKNIELVVSWDEFPQSGLEFNHLRRLANEVLAAFRSLNSDNLGREAIASVKTIALTYSAGSTLETSFHEGTLRIPSDGKGTKVNFESVKSAIEAAL